MSFLRVSIALRPSPTYPALCLFSVFVCFFAYVVCVCVGVG